MKTIGIIGVLILGLSLSAQGSLTPPEMDKKGIKDHPLREADVMWSTTLWRIIDLREKMNLPLYYPLQSYGELKSMWTAIDEGIKKGYLYPFKAKEGLQMVDDFREEMTLKEYLTTTSSISNIPLYNELGEEEGMVSDTSFVNSSDVIMYKIKEQWFIDKQRSVLDVRIIGIAPMKAVIDPMDGVTVLGYDEMFWLYFPWCRDYFATIPVFNRHNDSERLSLDDFFKKRLFTALVVKESNVYNRNISDYLSGVDALYEEAQIRERIMNKIMNLWHY